MSTTNVLRVEYDEAAQTLTVYYACDVQWVYHPVDPLLYAAILNAKDMNVAVKTVVRSGTVVGTKLNRKLT